MAVAHATVQLEGLDVAEAFFKNLASGIRAAAETVVLVGSNVEYAPPQEARRGYLSGALEAVRGDIVPDVARALPLGGQAVRGALARIATEAASEAQRRAPVRTGNLRRSIHTVQGVRG